MKIIIIISISLSCALCISSLDNNFIADLIPNVTPKVALCNNFKDLFDNGVYLKTACFVHQSLSYDAAKHKCAEHNMNLFIMNNEIVASHVMDAAQE